MLSEAQLYGRLTTLPTRFSRHVNAISPIFVDQFSRSFGFLAAGVIIVGGGAGGSVERGAA